MGRGEGATHLADPVINFAEPLSICHHLVPVINFGGNGLVPRFTLQRRCDGARLLTSSVPPIATGTM